MLHCMLHAHLSTLKNPQLSTMLNSQESPSSQEGGAIAETASAAAKAESTTEQKPFSREKHIQYFKRILQMIPQPYTSMDAHR